jgi:hypothetical protein
MTRFAAILLALALPGCASGTTRCLLDSQRPMTVVDLFFGSDIPGREPVTDREWSDFVASVIAKEFPQGFTVTEGDGEWQNAATRAVTRERSKILIVAAPPTSDLAARISRIRDSYSNLYRQSSVGVVTYDACGKF